MTDRRKDKMSLVAFMQAGSTSVYAGSCAIRRPNTATSTRPTTPRSGVNSKKAAST